MQPIKIAIQYPSFGPQHPPRLEAIFKYRPTPDSKVVALEMFKRDSDYAWREIEQVSTPYERYTVLQEDSATARKSGRQLKRAVFAALDTIQPDVLVVNGWGHKESRAALNWCRSNKCKIVLLSDSVYENTRRFVLLEFYKKWLLRGIKSGFAAGTPQARYLNRLGIPSSNIFYPGSCVVDNDYWSKTTMKVRESPELFRQEFNLPNRYFLCVARFIKFKNIPFLIRAYSYYRQIAGTSAIDLVICGSGEEENTIHRLIRELDVKGTHIMGFRQVDELPAFYGLADCFILPSSHFECWGFVINEAMASGLPVLISRMVGSAEDLVQPGVNGELFNPQDHHELAKLMLRLSSNEALREQMGFESRKIIAMHSPEIAAQRLWAAVNAALQSDQFE